MKWKQDTYHLELVICFWAVAEGQDVITNVSERVSAKRDQSPPGKLENKTQVGVQIRESGVNMSCLLPLGKKAMPPLKLHCHRVLLCKDARRRGEMFRTTGSVKFWTVSGRVMGSHWKRRARYMVVVMPKKVAASVARVMVG